MRDVFRSLILICMMLSFSLCAQIIDETTPNFSGAYHDPETAGWGINVSHQGNLAFVTWFTYDDDRKPMWLTISAQTLDNRRFSGEIFRTSGIPFEQINGSASTLTTTRLGTASLTFTAPDRVALGVNFSAGGGRSGLFELQRLVLGNYWPICRNTFAARTAATNHSDLWWNPDESGWGVNLYQQGPIMFATWFTYGERNQDRWYVMSRGERQADGSFKGSLALTASGAPVPRQLGITLGILPPADFELRTVGELTLRFFNGEFGLMTYTVDGITQTKPIRRQAFGIPQPVCRDGTLADFPALAGNGFGCFRQLGVVESRILRTSKSGEAAQFIQRGGNRKLGTLSGYTLDTFDTQNRLVTREYYELSAFRFSNIGVENYDPATGQLLTRSRYTTNSLPVELAVGTDWTQSYQLIPEFVADGQRQNTISYKETITRQPNDAVTVAAGSYPNVCRFDAVRDARSESELIGFATETRTETTTWTSSDVGTLKSDAQVSRRVNGTFVPSETEQSELIRFIPE
jgi:hypothetical protein